VVTALKSTATAVEMAADRLVLYGQPVAGPPRDDEYGTKERFLATSPSQLGLLINYTALARIDPARGVDSVQPDVKMGDRATR
jgi:hypothetical protein